MIWFACRQCGKVHGRQESSSGMLMFCGCGQGNTVPWESTAEPPAPSVVLDADFPVVAEVHLPEVGVPVPPMPTYRPVAVSEEVVPPSPGRRAQPEERGGAGWCFNHPRVRGLMACDACQEQFCGGCLVTVESRHLCGPCKNRELRQVAEAPKVSGHSVGSVVTAGLGVPLLMVLALAGSSVLTLTLALLALLPMALACGLGWQALGRLQADPRQGGRSLALTGMVGGVLGSVLALVVVASYWLQWG